jgi:hypothetical protein
LNEAVAEERPPPDPIIVGLLDRLPKSGDVWSESERTMWLDLLKNSFKLIYKDEPEEQFRPKGWDQKEGGPAN